MSINDALELDERAKRWTPVREQIEGWLSNMNIRHTITNGWDLGMSIRITQKNGDSSIFALAITERGKLSAFAAGAVNQDFFAFLDFARAELDLELWGNP